MADEHKEPEGWVEKDDLPLLSLDEQIRQLKSQGVTFWFCSEEDAKAYLSEKTYYFKLRSYRTLFDKRVGGARDGQYINLDFGFLRALASLDRDLRYALLPLTLDVEHAARTKLLRIVTEREDEDGYGVCEDYMASMNSKERNRRKGDVGKLKDDVYCGDLLKKYGRDPAKMPAWVLLELFSFGSFIDLYLFCSKRWGDDKMANEHYLLRQAKSVRNACAHSSGMLNGIRRLDDPVEPDANVEKALARTGLSHRVRTSRMCNPRIKQITTLMYMHSVTVTKGRSRERAVATMQGIKARMAEVMGLMPTNDAVVSSLSFLTTVIDDWFI